MASLPHFFLLVQIMSGGNLVVHRRAGPVAAWRRGAHDMLCNRCVVTVGRRPGARVDAHIIRQRGKALRQPRLQAMLARGRVRLGDKTVVDGIAAVADAVREPGNSDDLAYRVVTAVYSSLEDFDGKASRGGRSRIA